MNFDQEIYKALSLAGDAGLKAEKIARHVFNANNSMFHPLVFKDVHTYVLQFLRKNSKASDSAIEKGEGLGIYRLNRKNTIAQQFMLQFAPHDEEQAKANENGEDTRQLSLFD